MALALKSDSDLSRFFGGRDRQTTEDLLRELISEVQGLRADLASNQSPRSATLISRGDRALLAKLLPAIGGVFGSELFLVRELFESDAAAVRLVLRGLNAKQVGRLLRRAEGQAIDGYLIQQDGVELHAVLWRLVQLPEFSNVRNLPVPPQHHGGLKK